MLFEANIAWAFKARFVELGPSKKIIFFHASMAPRVSSMDALHTSFLLYCLDHLALVVVKIFEFFLLEYADNTTSVA